MQYIIRQPLAFLLPAFALLLTLPGCGGLGKMEKAIEELNIKMDPEPLVLRGDEVHLRVGERAVRRGRTHSRRARSPGA